MASDHQVALTRTQRMPAPSSHISKAARQVVPAFLQKLYEMVNDPNNAELIRWSDAGDSFFVLDHERFAHEVLGRWFKHRNFSSFVRQLNMYGFHKIPHLQQGVLKSDSDTEFWNFAHQNFHRGQPDLLCLIQRKKQVPQPGEDGAIDLRDGGAVGLLTNGAQGGQGGGQGGQGQGGGGQGQGGLSQNQILDIHSIVQGIQAIKRHQTTISAELNELKRSNQLLWQDALAARAKHQKQQDTINRIVKFLAGVFGHAAGAAGAGGLGLGVGLAAAAAAGGPGVGGGAKDDHHEGAGVHGSRRRARLMIEDTKREGPRKSMIEELSEMPMDQDEGSGMFEATYPTSIETPLSAPSPSPSVALSDNISIADAGSSSYFNSHHSSNSIATSTSNNSGNNGTTGNNGKTTKGEDTPSSSSAATTPSIANVDSPILSASSAGTPTQAHAHTHTQGQHGKEISRTVTPGTPGTTNSSATATTAAAAGGGGQGQRQYSPSQLDFHGVLNQLSPVQIQQLLASLAAQTIDNPASSSSGIGGGGASAYAQGTINPSATTSAGGVGIGGSPTGMLGNGTLAPYLQPSSFDFSINPASGQASSSSNNTSNTNTNSANNAQIPLVSPEGLIPFDPYDVPLSFPSSGPGSGGAGSGAGAGPGADVNMNLMNHSDWGMGGVNMGGGGFGGMNGMGGMNMGGMGMGGYGPLSGLSGLSVSGLHDSLSGSSHSPASASSSGLALSAPSSLPPSSLAPSSHDLQSAAAAQAHAERMHRQWQGAEDVEKEMSMVDSSIQSLIQTFGLDPGLMDDAASVASSGSAGSGGGGGGTLGEGGSPIIGAGDSGPSTGVDTTPNEFDFDSFFNGLSSTSTSTSGTGAGGGVNGAYMTDDSHPGVPSPIPGGGSPALATVTAAPASPVQAKMQNQSQTQSQIQNQNQGIRHVSPAVDSDFANDDLFGVPPSPSSPSGSLAGSLAGSPSRAGSPSPGSPSPSSPASAMDADDADDDDDVDINDDTNDDVDMADSSLAPTLTSNANPMGGTTSTIGRKRKSEIDLDSLGAALDPSGGSGGVGAGAASGAAAGGGKAGKAKRRKDK